VTEDEVVDVEVVTVDLPTPWRSRGWSTHHTQPIKILAIFGEPPRHLQRRLIEAHDVPRGLKSFAAKAFPQKRKSFVALAIAHLEDRHAVTHERGMNVAPLAPFDSVHREKRLGTLLG